MSERRCDATGRPAEECPVCRDGYEAATHNAVTIRGGPVRNSSTLERRFRGCASCGMQPAQCKCAAPQEGAPALSGQRAVVGPRDDEPAGAPSCDSELAAILALGFDKEALERYAASLLRMVDELTVCQRHFIDSVETLRRERDELRAKLAERYRLGEEAARQAEEARLMLVQTEAKLAEATAPCDT